MFFFKIFQRDFVLLFGFIWDFEYLYTVEKWCRCVFYDFWSYFTCLVNVVRSQRFLISCVQIYEVVCVFSRFCFFFLVDIMFLRFQVSVVFSGAQWVRVFERSEVLIFGDYIVFFGRWGGSGVQSVECGDFVIVYILVLESFLFWLFLLLEYVYERRVVKWVKVEKAWRV